MLMLAGCADCGAPQHVILYSDNGKVLQEWDSTGMVYDTDSGYSYFTDAKTGRAISVKGTVVQIEKSPSR